MDIQGAGGISGPNRIEPQKVSPGRTETADLGNKIGDRAEISETARLLSQLAEVPEVRMEKVEELKELIASGQYESKEKIEQAVERLMDEL